MIVAIYQPGVSTLTSKAERTMERVSNWRFLATVIISSVPRFQIFIILLSIFHLATSHPFFWDFFLPRKERFPYGYRYGDFGFNLLVPVRNNRIPTYAYNSFNYYF